MRMTVRMLVGIGGLVVALGCGGLPGVGDEASSSPSDGGQEAAPVVVGEVRNVLLVVADDLGTDKVAAYREHPDPPETPVLDHLASEGVLFENAYSYSTGPAARSALLTGRYGRRTGLGGVVDDPSYELPLDEVLLPEMLTLAPEAWSTAALGTWQLAGDDAPTGLGHAHEQGFGHVAATAGDVSASGYFAFDKHVNGEVSSVEQYATTDTTDDAIEQLNRMQPPWLLYVAYHAPREPAHAPPTNLVHTPVDDDAPEADRIDAAIEALDTELGRLLDAMSPAQRRETLVVFVGDNGTSRPAVRPPRDSIQGKSSLFEGGTNVPLIVRGPGVAQGQRTAALAHVVDLFPTIAAAAKVDLTRLQRSGEPLVLDGVSLWGPLGSPAGAGARPFVYTEKFRPVGTGPFDIDWRAVRDDRYKVMDVGRAKPSFFDLEGRFDDGPALRPAQLSPAEKERYDALMDELRRVSGTDAN